VSDRTCREGLPTLTKQAQQLDHAIIRFAGDSGDGMQLGGDRFTQETAIFGNDLSTLPNFPAESQAPAGTRGGARIPTRLGEQSLATGHGASRRLPRIRPSTR
jgi:hypothetical protein